MRKRLMEYGITIGPFPRGKRNLITDVKGVKVGNITLITDSPHVFRTGLTVVMPHGECVYNNRVMVSYFVLNGYGKSMGLLQVGELGLIETPIAITSTLNAGRVWDGIISYVLAKVPNAISINPIVMECNDGRLSESVYRPITADHVFKAISEVSDTFPLGNVGAGTGMTTFGYKGGLGSASRVIGSFTVGALVVSNFGRTSDIHGYNIVQGEKEVGSIIVVLATDAPLIPRQLNRLSKRGALGIAKAGGFATHGSGDIVISFSTAYKIPKNGSMSKIDYISDDTKLFQQLLDAAVFTVWEAIYDALLTAEEMKGKDGKVYSAIDPHYLIKKVKHSL